MDHGIRQQVNLQVMLEQITERFDSYDTHSDVYALKDKVLNRVKDSTCTVISYESWLDALSHHSDYSSLVEFKDRCYQFNRIC